jgi:MFS family permease
VLLTGSLLSALLAISQGNTWGWSSSAVLSLALLGATLLVGFAFVERRSPAPMVDMRVMGQRAAWSANVAAFAIGVGLFIAGVLIPMVATLPATSGHGFGLTYAQTGLVLLPGALGILLGGWVAGTSINRVGARWLVGCGALSAAFGYAVLAFERDEVVALVLANVPVGFGIGVAVSSITNLVVGSVDDTRTAAFAATTAVSRSIGAALGSQVAVAIVVSAGVVAPGLPVDSGFTGGFLVGLVAALMALGATLAIPERHADPLVEVTPSDSSRGYEPRRRRRLMPGG